jgi:hypothetical protein
MSAILAKGRHSIVHDLGCGIVFKELRHVDQGRVIEGLHHLQRVVEGKVITLGLIEQVGVCLPLPLPEVPVEAVELFLGKPGFYQKHIHGFPVFEQEAMRLAARINRLAKPHGFYFFDLLPQNLIYRQGVAHVIDLNWKSLPR